MHGAARPLLFALPAAAAAAATLLTRVRFVQAQENPAPPSAVYGWGRSQLFLDGSGEPRLSPLLVPALCRQSILDLVMLDEARVAYAVTKDKVLTWREGDTTTQEVKGLRDVQKLACARDGHCIALTRAGAALRWQGTEAPKKMKVDGQKVVDVRGGGRHLAMLTDAGDLYTIGANEYGQLGAGDHNPRTEEPVKVAQQVASVSCGDNHTLYATKAGRTYGMGSNAWCQIGQREPWETGFAAYNVPEAVPALARKKVTEVVCGADFSFALTDSGELYSWGVGRWGQLADGQGKHVKAKPMPVKRVPFGGEAPDKALGAKIVCGSEHCLALLTSGQLWAWGQNAVGQLGTGRLVVENSPVLVMKDRPLKKVFAGSTSSVAAE